MAGLNDEHWPALVWKERSHTRKATKQDLVDIARAMGLKPANARLSLDTLTVPQLRGIIRGELESVPLIYGCGPDEIGRGLHPRFLAAWRKEAEADEVAGKGYPATPRILSLLDELERLRGNRKPREVKP